MKSRLGRVSYCGPKPRASADALGRGAPGHRGGLWGLALYCALTAWPAGAFPAGADGCPGDIGALAAELAREFPGDSTAARFACADVGRAVSLAPVVRTQAGGWRFKAEEELRTELGWRYGLEVSGRIVPYGFMERAVPGKASFVLVFGSGLGREWMLYVLAGNPSLRSAVEAVRDVQEGWGRYDSVGIYPAGPGARTGEPGFWKEVEGNGAWEEERGGSPPPPYRACLPCRGWLCADVPLACFSDLDGDGREEVHLPRRGSNFSGMTILEPAPAGAVAVLWDEDETPGS